MKRKLTGSSLAVLLLGGSLLLLSGCGQGQASDSKESQESAGPPPATPVDGFVIQPSTLEESIDATGNLIAYESIEVRPERSGKITKIYFRESSFVRKGARLAQIDDSELKAQKAQLAVNLELAEKEVARGKELREIQGISIEEQDRLENRVEDIKAQMRILDIQIEKSKVKAPFSGQVGLRQISQGAYVTPADVLVTLTQTNPIKLEFEVPEKYLTRVKDGQELKFTIVGSDQVFRAKVYAIGSAISPTTRTFTVRANAPNDENVLKPGQFAKITLVTGINDSAMLVPTDAVIPVLAGKQVFLARNGRAIAQPVETADRQAAEVQIIDGVSLGDTVIVSGLLSLSDGNPIRVDNIIDPIKPESE